MAKSEAEVARELYESVVKSIKKQRRLKSSTFWRLFDVKKRTPTIIDRINQLLKKQELKVSVKSGEHLGTEGLSDWVVVTLILGPLPQVNPVKPPSSEWFKTMTSRSFGSEREIEHFFICPLLTELGYESDDIAIGYSVMMFKGAKKTTTEADIVVFKGPDRDEKSTLLVIETKKGDKGINVDHIKQAKSYAQELLTVGYVVTNGQEINVFYFNGSLGPDERVMTFDRTDLMEKWQDLNRYIGKEATLKRKELLLRKMDELREEAARV